MKRALTLAAASLALVAPSPARGQQKAAPSTAVVTTASGAKLTLGGYVETYFAWNFNDPSNGITNYRGFDNRHDTFTLSNAALDSAWSIDRVSGRLTLQFGQTGQTYYAGEPSSPATRGAGASNADVWKYLQQAYVGYDAPLGRGLLIEAGLFVSPIGPEGLAVKDQWNWSRSNLFFALPYYHAGARLTYPLTDRWSATLAAYNGWNSVVDGNDEKSLSASAVYSVEDAITWSILYFGGNERPRGAPEGHPWRHLLDSFVAFFPAKELSLLAHLDGGFERNDFGTSAWVGGALYARVHPLKWLYVAARVDRIEEQDASNATGNAARLFFPASWVESGTLTGEVRPVENVSFRLEYRHDEAEAPMYFRGTVQGDGTPANAFLPSSRRQDTILLGMTAWF